VDEYERGQAWRKIIILKNSHDLEQMLIQLGCKKHPCVIGRLGEVYVISQPGQNGDKK
jgi:hypothetical protein